MGNSVSLGQTSTYSSDDRLIDFLWAMRLPLVAYSRLEFERLAQLISHTLRRLQPSGIFGSDRHRHQWDEFSYWANFGPSTLDSAFEQLVDPLIKGRLSKLDDNLAVLLTMAVQWERDDLEGQDGTWASQDILADKIKEELIGLALQEEICFAEG